MHKQNRKTALILGVTGLVGNQLLALLAKDDRYSEITCLVRKPLSAANISDVHNKLRPIVVDFDNLQEYQGYFTVDHVYVCLGTTIKKAGSKTAFRKVDFEYVHVAAQLSGAQSVRSFVWVSSVGADAKSHNFYLRVKGELENAIFNLSGLDNAATVRPSLLLGERVESRPAEQIGIVFGKLVAPLLCGRFKRYRPVHADTVAKQMINLQDWN